MQQRKARVSLPSPSYGFSDTRQMLPPVYDDKNCVCRLLVQSAPFWQLVSPPSDHWQDLFVIDDSDARLLCPRQDSLHLAELVYFARSHTMTIHERRADKPASFFVINNSQTHKLVQLLLMFLLLLLLVRGLSAFDTLSIRISGIRCTGHLLPYAQCIM